MALAGGDALLAVERELVDLAAEADHQHAAEIRVPGIAGQRAVQHHHAVTGGAHAASLAVDDRHETVDARIYAAAACWLAWSAMAWQTVAEQFTLATMPMKLRVPARPSARR